MPSPFVSYFDPFIAAFAFSTLPWPPSVLYGLYSASWSLKIVSGTMWLAIVADRRAAPRLDERGLVHDPVHRPPDVHVVERRLGEVHRQVPGAVARVLVQVVFRFELVDVLRAAPVAGSSIAVSSSPACTLARMSSAFASTMNSNPSGKFSRAAFESVDGLVVRVAHEVRCVWPSKPLAGLSAEHDEASTASAPSIMYGPVETRSAVLAGLALEALRDLRGIGPVAGIAIAEQEVAGRPGQVEDDRLLFGHLMPEIVFALPAP